MDYRGSARFQLADLLAKQCNALILKCAPALIADTVDRIWYRMSRRDKVDFILDRYSEERSLSTAFIELDDGAGKSLSPRNDSGSGRRCLV